MRSRPLDLGAKDCDLLTVVGEASHLWVHADLTQSTAPVKEP